MATDIDAESLRADPFWNKKIDRACEVTDYDRNGWMERSDFKGIASRIKEVSTVKDKPGRMEAVIKSFNALADGLGLVDDSVRLTYAECKERWSNFLVKFVKEGMWSMLCNSTFDNLDANGDENIDIDEWRSFYYSLGIPEEHAQASFDAMDANGDGLISREEFAAYYTEFFTTAENKLNSAIFYGPLPEWLSGQQLLLLLGN